MSKQEFNKMFYSQYFTPELKIYIDSQIKEGNNDKNFKYIKLLDQIPDNFEINRKNGENEDYLCKVIQRDEIEEFISIVNRENISLKNTIIKHSIFDTNEFLLNQNYTSIIEYAAFYGSIQIFQYLKYNDVKLHPYLWLYAIHSNNAEIIHHLEENEIESFDMSYYDCLNESIKCHHNDIADYIQNFLLKEENKFDEEISLKLFLTPMTNIPSDEDKYLNEYQIKVPPEFIYDKNIVAYSFHYCNFDYFPKENSTKNQFHRQLIHSFLSS